MLRNVPIVVSEIQVSRPLVPVRVELQAAAAAADAKQWEKAKSLLGDANRQIQQLTTTADKETKGLLSPVADQLNQLTQQAQSGTNPRAADIRAVAERTRSIGGNGQNNEG